MDVTDREASRYAAPLRWYPPAWRRRYGGELSALLADTYGDRPIPRRERIALACAGLMERARMLWSDAAWRSDADRVRDGAALVLWAWAFVVVGGIAFAKAAEHWDRAVPAHDRLVPAVGYGAVAAAAGAGAVMIGLAAALALPTFVRYLHAGHWSDVATPLAVAIAFTAATVVTGVAVAAWACHLTPADRNGGSTAYGIVAVLGATLVAATVVAWTNAALRAATSIDLAPRIVRGLGLLSVTLAGAILVIVAGVAAWWSAVAVDAPWFFGGAGRSSRPIPLSPMEVAAGVLLTIGTVLAVRGAWRVMAAFRPAAASKSS